MPRFVLTHRRAVVLMVLVALMWSIAGVVTRQLESARSFEVTFWRSFFTAASLLVILPLWRGPRVFAQMHWASSMFWLSSVCWAVMFTAFMLALMLTTTANVLITLALGPLLTALASRFFMRHQLPLRTWAAIAAAGGGISVMFASQFSLSQPSALWGCAVALCVPIAAAVQWTAVQYSRTRVGQTGGQEQEGSVDLVPCVLVGAGLSALATLPLALPFAATGGDVAWLALLGLVQLAIPCTLSVLCARVLKAPEVSLLALLEVIFGIALAWAGANEVPGPNVLAGGALVLTALVSNELIGWKKR